MKFLSISDRVSSAGFTLVESIVTVAIVGLITAVALPFFGNVVHRTRLSDAAHQVDTLLLSARLQAIKREANIGVLISTDSTNAATYLKPTTFIDSNANLAMDAGESVIGVSELPASFKNLTFSVDAANKTAPGTTAATWVFEFTPFGSALKTTALDSSTDSFYVFDTKSSKGCQNILQVGISNALAGKVALTKLSFTVTSASCTAVGYVPPTWTWY